MPCGLHASAESTSLTHDERSIRSSHRKRNACSNQEGHVVLVIGLRRLKAWPQRHMPPYSMAIEFTTRASPAAWRATDSAVSRCSSVATWPVRYTT